MMSRNRFYTAAKLWSLALICVSPVTFARPLTVSSSETGLSAQLNEKSGEYRITARDPAWSFAGSLGSAASASRTTKGSDRIGAYEEMTFTWQSGQLPLRGTIRLYQDQALVLFRYTYLKSASPPSVAFPSFTKVPEHLYHFSYRNAPFAPPQFELGAYGTPWLFFDPAAKAMVISPASHFIVASMQGDGNNLIASGLGKAIGSVPAGFTQQTLMAIAPGIRHTWRIWGSGLTCLSGKKVPGNESDITLKYYGYWTDNGAEYYYKYDPGLGYAGTLKAVVARYREEKLPVRYLQLDSWWYDKSYPGMSPDDHTGRWKAFGGIMRYHADASLFPEGLEAFQRSVGLPLVTHSRWISQQSPYRQNYQISGVAPIGAKWWDHVGAYLQSSGVVTYEQDWQSLIDKRSPTFSHTITAGKQFYDHMAAACRDHGVTMQYCMALPCDFLQGSRYGNLTSIRTSDDRFSRPRWRDFLYTSQLAYAVGSWPWTDVYFSDETDNMLLDSLSAGPVGTGDALGAEDRNNILKAVRADGVIVKPDVPIIPLDRMYIADASTPSPGARRPRGPEPFIASAWTDDGAIRTAYVFAFSRSGRVYQPVRFSPAEVGALAPACVYDYFTHQVTRLERGQEFKADIGPGETGYYIVAPVSPSGVALFGDAGKFASMGKERIASLLEGPRSLTAQVLFAADENSVTLFGDAPSEPTVTVRGGSAGVVAFTRATGYFSVRIAPQVSAPPVRLDGDLVRRVEVTFAEP
jgi:hypothetical protein